MGLGENDKFALFAYSQAKQDGVFRTCAVRGYQIYKEIWEPNVGDKFVALRVLHNQFNKYAIKVLNGGVYHVKTRE